MDTDKQTKDLVRKAEHTKDAPTLWAIWRALDDMSAFTEAEKVKRWAIKAECRFNVEVEQ